MAARTESPVLPESSGRQVDPTLRMQVYYQGSLDGACFLYAQANAYKALTGKKVTREHWRRAVSRLPDAGAFLGATGATDMGYGEAVELIEVLLDEFRDPSEKFSVEQLSASAAIRDLCSEISSDTVVVFAYGGRSEFLHPVNHIVCGVAARENPATLHLACSATFLTRYLRDGDYSERHHPHLGRWSNDSISDDQNVTIAPNFRWRVTLARLEDQ